MVVIDIDGVLADARHREHHLRGRPDWDAFFAAAADDEVIEAGRQGLAAAALQGPVVLLTGRPERLRALTEEWLARHGLSADSIVMRPDSDRRPARVFKREALDALGGPTGVGLVVDDDPEVAQALHESGYLVHLFDGRAWAAGESASPPGRRS